MLILLCVCCVCIVFLSSGYVTSSSPSPAAALGYVVNLIFHACEDIGQHPDDTTLTTFMIDVMTSLIRETVTLKLGGGTDSEIHHAHIMNQLTFQLIQGYPKLTATALQISDSMVIHTQIHSSHITVNRPNIISSHLSQCFLYNRLISPLL